MLKSGTTVREQVVFSEASFHHFLRSELCARQLVQRPKSKASDPSRIALVEATPFSRELRMRSQWQRERVREALSKVLPAALDRDHPQKIEVGCASALELEFEKKDLQKLGFKDGEALVHTISFIERIQGDEKLQAPQFLRLGQILAQAVRQRETIIATDQNEFSAEHCRAAGLIDLSGGIPSARTPRSVLLKVADQIITQITERLARSTLPAVVSLPTDNGPFRQSTDVLTQDELEAAGLMLPPKLGAVLYRWCMESNLISPVVSRFIAGEGARIHLGELEEYLLNQRATLLRSSWNKQRLLTKKQLAALYISFSRDRQGNREEKFSTEEILQETEHNVRALLKLRGKEFSGNAVEVREDSERSVEPMRSEAFCAALENQEQALCSFSELQALGFAVDEGFEDHFRAWMQSKGEQPWVSVNGSAHVLFPLDELLMEFFREARETLRTSLPESQRAIGGSGLQRLGVYYPAAHHSLQSRSVIEAYLSAQEELAGITSRAFRDLLEAAGQDAQQLFRWSELSSSALELPDYVKQRFLRFLSAHGAAHVDLETQVSLSMLKVYVSYCRACVESERLFDHANLRPEDVERFFLFARNERNEQQWYGRTRVIHELEELAEQLDVIERTGRLPTKYDALRVRRFSTNEYDSEIEAAPTHRRAKLESPPVPKDLQGREEELLQRYLDNPDDPSCFEEACLSRLDWLRERVSRFSKRLPLRIDPNDLFQEAYFGLCEALKAYDQSLGVPFPQFASTRVWGAMQDDLRDRDHMPRLTRGYVTLVRELEARTLEFPEDAGKTRVEMLYDRYVQMYLDPEARMSIEEFQHAVEVAERAHDLLDLEAIQDDDGNVLYDLLSDGGPGTVLETLATKELALDFILNKVHFPNEHIRFILGEYYFKGRVFREIAHDLGLTESRVCQIHGSFLEAARLKFTESMS